MDLQKLRPTVKRNLSLYSVEAWQGGYTKYLKERQDFWYDIYFHYDGEKVNFYHKLSDFEYFKKVITEKFLADEALFLRLNSEFLENIDSLKKLLASLTLEDLPEAHSLAGKIMSLYIFIVSDDFVNRQPKAWDSRHISEGILYELDEKAEEVLAQKLNGLGLKTKLAHVVSLEDIQKILKGETLDVKELEKRLGGYILFDGQLTIGEDFSDYCVKNGLVNPGTDKNKLVFEKTIAREMNLISAQLWHDVMVGEMKKDLGWSYTEVVFEGRGGNVALYRATTEHLDGMLKFMLSSIDQDPEWLSRQIEFLRVQTEVVRGLMRDLDEFDLDSVDRNKLALWLRGFFDQGRKLVSGLVIVLWLPIHLKDHPLEVKYKQYIDLAVSCRENVTVDITTDIDNFLSKIVNFISETSHLDKSLAPFMSYDDVLGFLENGKEVSREELLKRERYYIVTNNGLLYEPIDEYLSRHGFTVKRVTIEGIREFTGSVAYKGCYKGRVVVVYGKDGLEKLEEGSVLVTTMTTPNFVPFLNKVGAIITDEGGITCHAAIMARELKKPCIIGTKVATQVLKDGDLVEVDASKGIVRILK